MLTSNLTVVDNHASLTLPGSLGSKVYAQVISDSTTQVKRQIAATALSTPQVLKTEHRISGSGFKARAISVVRHEYSDLTVDPADTGGETPSSAITLTINRPVNSGGAITIAKLKDQIGALLDVMLTTGQLDALLNMEG